MSDLTSNNGSNTGAATELVIPVDNLPGNYDESWGSSTQHSDTIIEDDDDDYREIGGIPVVGLVFMVIIFSACIGALIFYISYRQERTGLCSKKKKTLGGDGDALFHLKPKEEVESGLKVKAWQKQHGNYKTTMDDDYDASETDEASCCKSTVSDASNASTVSAVQLKLRQQPRCVLCSKRFQENDAVAESSDPNCDHQYHRDCIVSWLQKQDGCPICKRPYISQDVETA